MEKKPIYWLEPKARFWLRQVTIAAIRLRGEPVNPSPKLKSLIYDSISLARLVQGEIEK